MSGYLVDFVQQNEKRTRPQGQNRSAAWRVQVGRKGENRWGRLGGRVRVCANASTFFYFFNFLGVFTSPKRIQCKIDGAKKTVAAVSGFQCPFRFRRSNSASQKKSERTGLSPVNDSLSNVGCEKFPCRASSKLNLASWTGFRLRCGRVLSRHSIPQDTTHTT